MFSLMAYTLALAPLPISCDSTFGFFAENVQQEQGAFNKIDVFILILHLIGCLFSGVSLRPTIKDWVPFTGVGRRPTIKNWVPAAQTNKINWCH